MILFATLLSNSLFLAGVALFVIILLRRWHRYYGRRPRGKKETSGIVRLPRPANDSKRSLSTAPPEFIQWQVELHETARDLKAELDSKMIALQVLVASAQEQADRLERLLEQYECLQSSSSSAVKAEPESQISLLAFQLQHDEVHTLADTGLTAAQIAQRTGIPLGDIELILSLRSTRSQ